MCAPPPSGLYLQCYLDAGTGVTLDDLARIADRAHAVGMPGIALHAGPRRLLKRWSAYAPKVTSRGLLALAAWGLDGRTDDDGTALTASEKGDLCGELLLRPDCAAGLLDAEGRWDARGSPGTDMNEGGALTLSYALRCKAPTALVGDQPWFAIESHGDVRPRPLPLGQGGDFVGFPVDEFATVITWMRFPQAYCNDFVEAFGNDRYARVTAWMERDWTKVEVALKRDGLLRPRGVTLQGYGWRLRDLVHALLEYSVRRNQPVPLWCEPSPSEDTWCALRFVQQLVALGHAGIGIDPREAVRAFQRTYNRTAPETKKLDEDGYAGIRTLTSAGCWPPAAA